MTAFDTAMRVLVDAIDRLCEVPTAQHICEAVLALTDAETAYVELAPSLSDASREAACRRCEAARVLLSRRLDLAAQPTKIAS